MLSTHVEIIESIGRLSVALALGSVIGFERQWRQKMAGLRTNALVALGSCGFMVFSADGWGGRPHTDCGASSHRDRLSGCRHYFAAGNQRARTQHRSDLVVFCDGGHFRRRRLLGAEPGGCRDL